jgi:hypothetical protein
VGFISLRVRDFWGPSECLKVVDSFSLFAIHTLWEWLLCIAAAPTLRA